MPNLNFAEALVFRREEELLCKIKNYRQRDAPHSYFFYISTNNLCLFFEGGLFCVKD
jgi:hypothetical protein